MTPNKLHPVAQQLLDAHLAYLNRQSQGQALKAVIRKHIDGAFDDVAHINFQQLLPADVLKNSAVHIVRHLDFGPDLAKLVGEIARHWHMDPIHEETVLSELVPDAAYEVLVEQLLELSALRRAAFREVVANPIYGELVFEVIFHAIREYVAASGPAGKMPGARSAIQLGKNLVDKARPGLSESLEDSLKSFVRHQVQGSVQLSEKFLWENFDNAAIKDAVMQGWERVRDTPIAEIRDLFDTDQVQDIAMVATAFWSEFRGTDFVAAMIEATVDGFYVRHAQSSVGEILAELGVHPDLVRNSAMKLLPVILRQLQEDGALESIMRRILADFYASEEVTAILDAAIAAN